MGLPPILVEQWIEYPIGVSVSVLRLFARVYVVGWRNLYWDDLLAGLALLFWTSEATTIHLLNTYGTFIGLTEESANALSDAEVDSMETGSKALFSAWMSYICLIWCLKGSVLFFYYRLTIGLKEQKIVRVLAVAVVLSFLAMIFEILLQCRPVEKNWQIKPYAGDSCTLIYVRYYLLLVLNVSTDLGLMAFIPTPILWKAQIPIRRKLMVAVLLFSSVFIVVAAIIRCVMSVNEIRKIGTSGAWAIRETFVSIFVVNAPAIKPLFSRNQWNKSSKGTSGSTSRTGPKLSRTPQGDEVELRSGTYWSNKDGSSVRDVERGSASGVSDDNIIEPKDGLRINVTTAFATSTEQGSKLEEVEGEHRWSGAMGKAENRKTRDGWTRLGDMSRGETNTTVVADMRGS